MGISSKTTEAQKEQIQQPYTPTDDERGELTYIFDRFQKMKTRRSEEEGEWKKDEDQYEMVIKTLGDDENWHSKLKLPDTTSAILAFLSETIDQNPGISYIPREPSDREKADKYNAAFKYTWEKSQGNLELVDHLLQVGVYGTAIGKEYWCEERIKEKEVSEYEKDENDKDTYIPKKWKDNVKIVFDDTKYKSLYLKNFWVDEAATGIENASDCIELELWNEDRFHSNYDELYDDAKLVKENSVFKYDWYSMEEAKEKVEVLYYYNKMRDMFSIVANGILLTKPDNPNPYKHKELPYVQSVCIPRIKNFYGMGFPRLIRSLQEEKDTIRNMRIDAAKLGIGNMVVIDDRVELDDEDLEVRPNQIIRGPVDGITFIKPPDLNTATYKEEELLKEDIIRVTGVDPRLQTMGGAGDTATEIAILKESSMKRIRLIMRTIEWKALYRIGRLRLANFLQFYSIPKYRDIIGEDKTVQKEPFYPTVMSTKNGKTEQVQFEDMDFKGEYDIVVTAGSTLPISDAVENQKIINVFDRAKGHPDVNQRVLIEAVIRSAKSVYLPVNELMTKQGEPPMGQAQVGSMPGQGTGLQQTTQAPIQAMTARQTGGQNFNQ